MPETMKTDLTGFEEIPPGQLAHLERDRWPEFERELRLRRLRKIHFDLCTWRGERPRWDWLINRCRKWEEIERVLNRHNVDYRWKHRREVLELEDAEIYRLS
jgi:hypothetical protein